MIWRLFVCIMIFMCATGAALYDVNITKEEFINVTNKISYDSMNITCSEMSNNQNNTFVERGMYKFVDLYTYIIIDGSSYFITFGYNNPQYNYELLYKLLFISCFAVLVIPCLYLITFIGYFIHLLYVKIKIWRTKDD